MSVSVNLPASYASAGYNVYIYFNSNNTGNDEEFQITPAP